VNVRQGVAEVEYFAETSYIPGREKDSFALFNRSERTRSSRRSVRSAWSRTAKPRRLRDNVRAQVRSRSVVRRHLFARAMFTIESSGAYANRRRSTTRSQFIEYERDEESNPSRDLPSARSLQRHQLVRAPKSQDGRPRSHRPIDFLVQAIPRRATASPRSERNADNRHMPDPQQARQLLPGP